MQKKYDLIILPEAMDDIHAIVMYIAMDLSNPSAALNLKDDFESAIASLESEPKRIPIIDKQPWKVNELRRMIVKNYCVYFTVSDTDGLVYVMGVVYIGRDQDKQISGRGWIRSDREQ